MGKRYKWADRIADMNPERRPHDRPVKKSNLGHLHGCMVCRRFGGTMRPYGKGRVHFPFCPPPGARGVSERP